MPITLSDEVRRKLIASVKRYFLESLEQEIGDLKAELVLEFCLEEICPTVYNQAIADAQAYFLTKVDDIEGSCFEPEFSHWKKSR